MNEFHGQPRSAAEVACSQPADPGEALPGRLPQLRPYWSAYAFGPDDVELKSIGRSVRLSGAGAGALLPLLIPLADGTRTVDEMCALLGVRPGGAPERYISQLLGLGLLVDGVAGGRCPVCGPSRASLIACTFLEALVGLDRLHTAHDRLARSRVTLWGSDCVASRIAALLGECEVDVQVRSWPGPSAEEAAIDLSEEDSAALRESSLAVGVGVCARDRRLEVLNAACLAEGTPWLPVCSDAVESTVGPLVLPGRSACLLCLRGRLEALAAGPATLLRSGCRPLLAPLIGVVSGLAAYAAYRFLLDIDGESLVDQLARVKHRSLDLQRSDILRLPGCPACASARPPGRGR